MLERVGEWPLLDVRTPAEYEKGHVPKAVNFPLFSNEERTVVGTLYKQVSKEKAYLEGLEIVGPKMRQFVEQAKALAPNSKVLIHCWRGGQRSSSMGWLLGQAGFEVGVLVGGYKAYRKHVRERLAQIDLPLIVLGGRTGAGKTDVLKALQQLGEQVVDLEGLANHKGSAFGGLGEAAQPSIEHFENTLLARIMELYPQKRIWIENESRAIGRVYLPDGVLDNLQRAPMIDLQVPMEQRVQRLVEVYAGHDKAELGEAFGRIKKRLGGQRHKDALAALQGKDYAEAARIALTYYDKAYDHHVQANRTNPAVALSAHNSDTPEQIARQLVALANTTF